MESLLKYCTEEIQLLIHSDGTITDKDKEFMCSILGAKLRFSDFDLSKQLTLDSLRCYPNCQSFRAKSIWGIEFFDPIFANHNENISFYLDADILLLRPFTGLFEKNQVKGGVIFLKDTQWDAYSFRPWQMLTEKKNLHAVKGITTGLVFWDKSVIDWDYLEWFLGEHQLHQIPEWIMPTAQAGLAHRCEAKTISPRQITNLYPNAKIHNDTFGVHLLGSYRKQWMEKLEAREKKENLPIITPSFEKCVSQNIFGYSLRQIKRWINTRLNLW